MRVGLKRNANLHCCKIARFANLMLRTFSTFPCFCQVFRENSRQSGIGSKASKMQQIQCREKDAISKRREDINPIILHMVGTSIAQTFNRFTLGYNDFDFCLQNGAFQTGDRCEMGF